jgi:hypothetical protein
MRTARDHRGLVTGVVLLLVFAGSAAARYGGGTGEPNDPYLIFTAEHLRAIGTEPNDWDKHFKLLSDLDMSAYQGASESQTVRPIGLYSGRPFSGHFDGNGHTISHLTMRETGLGPVGLFGCVQPPLPSGSTWPTEADAVEVVHDLGLIEPDIQSSSNLGVGALIGYLTHGKISSCYVEGGTVKGANRTGGLVGSAPMHNMPTPHVLYNCYVQDCNVQGESLVGGVVGEFGDGRIEACWSVARVRGYESVGGLVGHVEIVQMFEARDTLSRCWSSGMVEGSNETGGLVGTCAGRGSMGGCYSVAAVQGGSATGGLVGANLYSTIANCYAVAPTAGVSEVGGLVGVNHGTVTACYAAGPVTGQSQAGGLIGSQTRNEFYPDGVVSDSFWDTDTSGQTTSAGGSGKRTIELYKASTFLAAGWDFVGETTNGTEDIWRILEGQDYPRLSWEQTGPYGGGTGEPNDPYLIFTAEQLNAVGAIPNDWDKHFQLMTDIDLSVFDGKAGRPAFNIIGTGYKNAFTGVFDGLGHTVSNLTLQDGKASGFGLFGFLGPYGEVSNLVIQDANVQGDIYVGPLVGYNDRGSVRYCYATGFVHARQYVGGLIGICTDKALTQCCTAHTHVLGTYETGGLVGANSSSKILQCSAGGVVEGNAETGGITGRQDNHSVIQDCYSSCTVSSTYAWASGIVGRNHDSLVSRCYATGPVVGDNTAGGLVARNINGTVEASFWDVQTSGQAASEGGVGKTTAEMQMASTFLDAGWDFVGETANGTEDIWWIREGQNYPRLWWEAGDGTSP